MSDGWWLVAGVGDNVDGAPRPHQTQSYRFIKEEWGRAYYYFKGICHCYVILKILFFYPFYGHVYVWRKSGWVSVDFWGFLWSFFYLVRGMGLLDEI